MINEEDFFDFYNQHWDDYIHMSQYLQDVIHKYNAEFASLQEMVDVLSNNLNPQDNTITDNLKVLINKQNVEIQELKRDLLACQDQLDEETHKVS